MDPSYAKVFTLSTLFKTSKGNSEVFMDKSDLSDSMVSLSPRCLSMSLPDSFHGARCYSFSSDNSKANETRGLPPPEVSST